jgi:hypothetical protein
MPEGQLSELPPEAELLPVTKVTQRRLRNYLNFQERYDIIPSIKLQ